jgi:hypothetical protein
MKRKLMEIHQKEYHEEDEMNKMKRKLMVIHQKVIMMRMR